MIETLNGIEGLKNLDKNMFFLLAGPCVIEGEEITFTIAEKLIGITNQLEIPFVFKASYRKASRTRFDSFSGIGDEKGLHILDKVRKKYNIPVITDVFSVHEAVHASRFVDILQIPAYLARQTDIIIAAAKTGKCINIKKGVFMSPASMKIAVDKVLNCGNNKIFLTERGTMFGYEDLVVDFRGLKTMQEFNVPVILDVNHAVHKPNQLDGGCDNYNDLIRWLSRAAIALNVDGLEIDVHPDPGNSKNDGSTILCLEETEKLLAGLVELKRAINKLDCEL